MKFYSLVVVFEGMRNTNYYWNRMSLLTGEEEKPEPVYAKDVNETFSLYKSIWRMKPDGTYMAGAMRSINQINLFDLKSGAKKSLIINHPVASVEELIDANTKLEGHRYYCDLIVTDSFIYALFMNQPYEDAFNKEKSVEIHMFSWDGEPRVCYTVPPISSLFCSK